MPREELKAKDKVVLKMSKEGAVQENMTQGSSEKVSKRAEEPELVKPQDEAGAEILSQADTDALKKKRLAAQHREAHAEAHEEPKQEPEAKPKEESSAPVQPEYKPGELPFHEAESSISTVSNAHHSAKVNVGRVVADTVVSHKLRKTDAVKSVDGEVVLNKAAETAAEKSPSNEAIPATRKIRKLEKKAEQAHERLDAAREALPKKKVIRKERVFDDKTGKAKSRLRFEDELKQSKGESKLVFEARKDFGKIGDTITSGVHGKIHQVEQENSAVEAAHRSEIVVEAAARHYSHHKQRSENKPYEKVSKLEHEAEIADTKLHYEKTQQEHPEMKKQRMSSKDYQKKNIKKEYAAARKSGTQTPGVATSKTGKKTGEKVSETISEFFEKNKKTFLWLGVGILIVVMLGAGISSCTAMLTSTGSGVISSSYLSEDDDMLGAEAQYCQMEAELKSMLDNYTLTHDYDEYHFDLDDIEHDPYVLISILSALHNGEFTLDEVQMTLKMLFEKQYILTEEVTVQTRYRTETVTELVWVTDPETGESYQEEVTTTIQVPYSYYICNVTLENFNLSHVPVYIMSQDQLSAYATYMSVLGNREDLFPSSSYVSKYITNPPAEYQVNEAYLADETFATLIEEAEKYLNYPYVWGGSNPSTSFDCSGFVSYVLTNSGLVNTGRLGAQGLYNVCTPVSKADAQPGDLIFFVGTYDTPGVSHVGIYVGDNVMLHCGDPIQYTSISSSYWQSHFYAFGRPDY